VTAVTGPRPRNAANTRASILSAARRRFVAQGYDGASLRDIAAEAKVDVALVSRYFGSKHDLFKAVLTSDGPPDGIVDGALSDFGERVARMFIIDPMRHDDFDKLLLILRSTSSPKVAEVIRQNGQETFYKPLADLLGGGDAAVKARLAGAILTGLAIMRMVDEDYLLTSNEREELCCRAATILQTIAEGT
jgi:AcrR family transcriptional regulator